MSSKGIGCIVSVLLIHLLVRSDGLDCNKVTEKEMKEYFHLMTTQMKESLPMVDMLIKNEDQKGHKAKMELAKRHIQEIIAKKEVLKNECEKHKLSPKQCCERAETMRKEMHEVLTREVQNH